LGPFNQLDLAITYVHFTNLFRNNNKNIDNNNNNNNDYNEIIT